MKKLLFSLLSGRDLIFTPTKGSGPGGQKRNKTSSAIHLKHSESGTSVKAADDRSQKRNKITALHRLAQDPKFKLWVRVKTAVLFEGFRNVEDKIKQLINPNNLKVEHIVKYNCDCGNKGEIVSAEPLDRIVCSECGAIEKVEG